MKRGQITIKDLARELGISPSTVSRALKDHPDISSKTKKLVSNLAKKLDYQPNTIALSLRSSRTHTIGVVIPELVHFFFSTVISGIEKVAYKAGYNVILCQSNESYQRELMDVNALLTHRVDGLLISVSKETTNAEHFAPFIERNLPLIFFDRKLDRVPASSVVVDDQLGGYQATCHLIDQGCKNILHLAGPEKLLISKNRKQGYLRALRENNLEPDPRLIIDCNSGANVKEAQQVVAKIISQGIQFDGIFANNDLTAIGAMNYLLEKGVKIPQEVAVVGYSNWQMASLVEPGLSSVNQPGFEMGQTAAQLFIDQISNATSAGITKKVVLESALVIRESSLRK